MKMHASMLRAYVLMKSVAYMADLHIYVCGLI